MTRWLAWRLRRMEAEEAAAFWIVRADSRGLTPREVALLDDWLASAANRAVYQSIRRTFALLDAIEPAEAGFTCPATSYHPRATSVASGELRMNPAVARALDLSAIGLSALCLVHCLALPALALALPLLGSWAHAEWVHVVFVSMAAPIALLALMDWSTFRPSSWRLVAVAGAGLGLMLAGALEAPAASWERPLTVIGGLLLATAHLINWRRRHAGHGCG